jgi:ribonuclease HII
MTLFPEDSGHPGPSFKFEDQHDGTVAGVDEVGRGPWAGPVVAAAVILDRNSAPRGLDDSKKLSAHRREVIYAQLVGIAKIGIGEASVSEIDKMNILNASLLAMRRAIDNLPIKPSHCLIDGRHAPHLEIPCTCIVKGDARSFSVAAASIVAKVTRDSIMARLAKQYPHYGWDRNAGYGVPEHKEALDLVGLSPHHRRSFAPIRKLISEDSLVTN